MGVRAIHVVVTATEDPGPAVARWVSEPDMCRMIDRVHAVDSGLEIWRRELLAAAQRCTGFLRPPDDGLLLCHRLSIPIVDHHRDLPDDHVRAAGGPGRNARRWEPDVLVDHGLVRPEDVVRTVLEAQQVTWCLWNRGVLRRVHES